MNSWLLNGHQMVNCYSWSIFKELVSNKVHEWSNQVTDQFMLLVLVVEILASVWLVWSSLTQMPILSGGEKLVVLYMMKSLTLFKSVLNHSCCSLITFTSKILNTKQSLWQSIRTGLCLINDNFLSSLSKLYSSQVLNQAMEDLLFVDAKSFQLILIKIL